MAGIVAFGSSLLLSWKTLPVLSYPLPVEADCFRLEFEHDR
jgi:hypothetical protein